MRYSERQRDKLQTGENLYAVQKGREQCNLDPKEQKRSFFGRGIARTRVISCKQVKKTFMHCKKAEKGIRKHAQRGFSVRLS